MSKFKFYTAYLGLAIFAVSCSSSDGGTGGTISNKIEPYCATSTTYTSSVAVSGSAGYLYREDGNQAVASSPRPIRFAEIQVLDTSGAIVQCAQTDANGNYSFSAPISNGTLSLRVNSRINSGTTQAYILDNPSDQDYYSLNANFVPNGNAPTITIPQLVAPATGSLEGGAFNILDQILDSNLYLESETSGCNATYPTCIEFVKTPLAKVFWEPGTNPGSYFGAGPVSFYLPGQNELYILGGQNGVVGFNDVDHFDNSVIIHEYGHFIEDNYSKTDSPGGSHNGNSIIDPRLAFGEGWANFLQAAVKDDPIYRDTQGNVDDGGAVLLFNENLETGSMDIPSAPGQGNFREFSITRALWDAIDTANGESGADSVTTGFDELWTVFAGTTGFASATHSFRSIGLFHSIQKTLASGADWTSIRTAEQHSDEQVDFANDLVAGACSATSILAAHNPPSFLENGSASSSNQFSSNDFYRINHIGGTLDILMSYTTSAINPADLDLYLYQESYNFITSSHILISSNTSAPGGAGPHSETISTNLPAGTYMLNVRVNTTSGLGGISNYSLTLGGSSVCPVN